MGDSPFDYPQRALDGLLSQAGEWERAARGTLRYLRSGELGALRRAMEQRRQAALPEMARGVEVATSHSVTTAADARSGAASSNAPILYLPAVAWSYRFQRPQQLARALAQAGHPLLYVDGFLRSRLHPARTLSRLGPRLHRLQVRISGRPDPYRQPLTRRQAAALAQVVLAGLHGCRPAMILVQLPFWAELGRELSCRLEAPLVYDRIDLHSGFPGVPPEIEEVEARLIRHADLVCATAGMLAERPREISPRVLLLPNGVDLDFFPASTALARRPFGPKRPIRVGYVGALGPWFDVEALRAAALALPQWSFTLAGKVEDPEVAALGALPNLTSIGEIPFRQVPGFLAGLDVALVPFRDLPLTRAVDPVKLYEALAAGLPVVARRLPETARWREPLVYSYSTPDEFVSALRQAIDEDAPELAEARRRAAEQESWDHRAAVLLEAVAALPPCQGCPDWTRS